MHGLAAPSIKDIPAFELMSGRAVRSFTYYRSWGAADVSMTAERGVLRALVARGTTPVLTFQPQRPGGGLWQPAYAHARILAGDYDLLLRQWAATLAAAGGTVVVRPMHEGNGTWYPWCAIVNGNTPVSYIAAWRYIRNIIVSEGATNTRWIWSVNKVFVGPSTPLPEMWPGDDVVDEVGISGYNGGDAVERGGWRSAPTIFDNTMAAIRAVTGKPVHLAETGSVEQGGDKAAWITEFWNWLQQRTDIAGTTWFDFNKPPTDWRVSTSVAAQVAYRNGVMSTIDPLS